MSLILALFFSFNCHATIFTNSYMTFEMPNDWDCVLAGSEWVCSPTSKSGQREATMILGAKAAGPEDRLDNFLKYLSNPKTMQLVNGTTAPSKVVKVQQISLNGQNWIEGIHLNSEIEDYYTRYLATAKERLSILMTMSAHKSVWNNYEPVFGKVKNSLKITATPQLLIQPPEKAPNASPITKATDDIPTLESASIPTHQPLWKQPFMIIAAIISLSVIGMAFYLRKK